MSVLEIATSSPNTRFTASFGSYDTSHQGASKTMPQLKDWVVSSNSADGDLINEINELTSRSRDLDRNDGLASGARITANDNVIGTGLKIAPKPNYRKLKKDSEWASEWAKAVKAEWIDFSESRFFDADGEMDFHQATQLMFDSAWTDGAGIAIPMWKKRTGTPFRTCFKIIDSDRLCNPDDEPDSIYLKGGVERNRQGEVVAYHIRNRHPGDDGDMPMDFPKWERIPARHPWGRSRFIHLYKKERPGQSRGKSKAAAVLAAFGMRGKYQLTELQAAIVNSKIAGILESDLTCEEAAEIFDIDKEELAEAQINWGGRLSAGAILNAPIGTKFKSHIPGRPQSGYVEYMQGIAREIGTGLGLPYELFARDFSQTNYSSARAALIEAWRHFNVEREHIAYQWADQCYQLFLEEAVELGFVDAPDFYTYQQAYSRADWLGLGYQPVDELKHAKSVTERLLNGTTTYQRIYAEMGLDAEEEIESYYRDQALHKEYSEKYDVPMMTLPGTQQPVEPEEQPEQES